jgi:beta-lactamase class A
MQNRSITDAIERISAGCGGVISVAVKGISGANDFTYNADVVTSSASIIKVPILVAAMRQTAEGKLSPDTEFELPEARTRGTGVLRYMHSGIKLTLWDLLSLMIIASDNAATNMVVDSLGMEAVNAVMESMGYANTRLRRKMMDWAAIDKGLDNTCTAAEIADLLARIAKNEAACGQWDKAALDILRHNQDKDKLGMFLPEKAKIANKTGARQGIVHDCGIITSGELSYSICVLTQGIASRGDAILIIAQISRLFYEYFTNDVVI